MYTILRRYRVRLGTVEQAATYAERTLVPQLRQVPTFIAHYLLDQGDNTLISLTLFENNEAAEAAGRVLADWFRSDWPAFRMLPPEYNVGEVVSVDAALRRATAAATAEPELAFAELRVGGEAAYPGDRRMTPDRRRRTESPVIERRSGLERRVVAERRVGLERRGAPVQRRRIAPPMRRREGFQAR
ncbi:MAG TPA: hypothetical protein VLV16_08355 [Gemmatimonadales bacterium]|nr:hypothetical protein [Gemmatimonadales bacterium]